MRSKFSTLTVLLALVTLVAGAQQPASPPPAKPEQQPPITFKVEVNYVEIDAVVTDSSGNFVRGLTRDDFEIVEQSKPQNITVFSLVDIPVERPDAPLYSNTTIERDVHTNRREFEGRVFVLVLDDFHTHTTRTSRVRLAARQFIERYLGENDVAAVVTTGGSKYASQNFTNSRRLLLKAVDSFMGQKLRSVTLEKLDQLSRPMPGSTGPVDPSDMERGYKARSTLDTLKGVADFLNGIRGRRKAVVFFSEGLDYDITNPIQNRDATTVIDSMNQATAGATRANVSFYSVDPRGLSGFEDAIEISSTPEDNSLGVHTLLNETRLAQDTLRTLSEETGGFAAINRNDYRDTFARIIRRQQQLLRPGLLLQRQSAGRPVPPRRRSRQASRAAGPRAKGLHAAADAPDGPDESIVCWHVARAARSAHQSAGGERSRAVGDRCCFPWREW